MEKNIVSGYEQFPRFLTVEQVAAILNIGRTTAYRLVRSGEIPSTKVGHQYRISAHQLMNFAKSA